MIIPSKEGNNMNDKTKGYNMIDEFHVMYMYKKSKLKRLLPTSKHWNSFEEVPPSCCGAPGRILSGDW